MASTDIARVMGPAVGRERQRADAAARAGTSRLDRLVPAGWLLPIVVALAMALFAESAYLLAERRADGQGIFAGQLWASHDVAQYVAAMNDGARGAWLIRDRLTAEEHVPAFIYGFYVLLGKVVHALGIDADAGYRLAGVIGRVFMLLAVYRTTSLVSPTAWRRQVAFGLTVLGGGLISLLTLLQVVTGLDLGLLGSDLNEPEFGTFILLFASPHLMVGLGLLLLAAHAYARAWRSRHAWDAVAAASLTVALGVVNSYSLATLCAVVSIHALVMTALARRLVWRGLIAAGLVNLAALPILAYGVLTFVLGADPFWGVAYGKQNVTPTPTLANVAAAFGLVLVLAVAGVRSFGRRATSGRVLVLVWIAAMALMMYLPVGVQRRFAFGLQPMLALVAAFALPPLWRFISAPRPRPWTLARPILILLLFQALVGSSAVLAAVAVSQALDAGTPGPGLVRQDFYPASLRPAARWLAEQSGPEDVVLAQPKTGNYLVREIAGRVYVGHWSATVDYEQKRREVAWFFAGPLDPERQAFLAARGIRYVVLGPIERMTASPAWTGFEQAGLVPIYDVDGVVIFAVGPA